jgi:hypothetical protein
VTEQHRVYTICSQPHNFSIKTAQIACQKAIICYNEANSVELCGHLRPPLEMGYLLAGTSHSPNTRQRFNPKAILSGDFAPRAMVRSHAC